MINFDKTFYRTVRQMDGLQHHVMPRTRLVAGPLIVDAVLTITIT